MKPTVINPWNTERIVADLRRELKSETNGLYQDEIAVVSDPSQPVKIALMKKAMLIGTIWGVAVLVLLFIIATK